MPDRHVNLTGASNFRDLGGYETEDGMKLKHGLIYRSDNLSHLSEGIYTYELSINNESTFGKVVLTR